MNLCALLLLCLCVTQLNGYVCPSCDSSNQQQTTCPCMRTGGSNSCMKYDSRYMATTIDEAMFSFPNLASYEQQPLFAPHAKAELSPAVAARTNNAFAGVMSTDQNKNSGEENCSTPDCLACKLQIISGFLDGSQKSLNDSLWKAKEQIEQQTGMHQGTCLKQNNNPKKSGKPNSQKQNSKKGNKVISLLKQKGKTRKIRSAVNDEKETLLGITTQIGCDYKKGTSLDEDDKWCGLCNLCWQWRRLPEEYFPTYVNEVACDTKDKACLAGFGTCRSVTRALNVLRNSGTKTEPVWDQATIEVASACECQVQIGTPLHYLVTR